MFIINKQKREATEGIEHPNLENIKIFRLQESYKYLGILVVANGEERKSKKGVPQKKKKTS